MHDNAPNKFDEISRKLAVLGNFNFLVVLGQGGSRSG